MKLMGGMDGGLNIVLTLLLQDGKEMNLNIFHEEMTAVVESFRNELALVLNVNEIFVDASVDKMEGLIHKTQVANYSTLLSSLFYAKERGLHSPAVFRVFSSAKKEDVISVFTLQEMPGCCGICINMRSIHMVMPLFRDKNVSHILDFFVRNIARCMGYTIMLRTTVSDSITNEWFSEWENIYSFTNKKTNNVVNISAIQI